MDYCRAFLLFSGFALPVSGGRVDNVQFATIIMLLPVSQQPGSASGVTNRTVQVRNSSVFTGSGAF